MRIEDCLENTEFIPSVVGYLVKNDKVLLGLRKKVSLGLGENLIAGIGGKVEAEESDDEALVREVREEIYIDVRAFRRMGRVRFIFPHKPKWNHSVTVYLIDDWQRDRDPIETDDIKPIWYQQDSLPRDQMWEDNLFWLPLVLSGKKIEGIFLYDATGKVVDYRLEELSDGS